MNRQLLLVVNGRASNSEFYIWDIPDSDTRAIETVARENMPQIIHPFAWHPCCEAFAGELTVCEGKVRLTDYRDVYVGDDLAEVLNAASEE